MKIKNIELSIDDLNELIERKIKENDDLNSELISGLIVYMQDLGNDVQKTKKRIKDFKSLILQNIETLDRVADGLGKIECKINVEGNNA